MIVEYLGKRMRPHELAQILEHARPTCRACGNETALCNDICPMCRPGYELAEAELKVERDKIGKIAAAINHWGNGDGDPIEALGAIGDALGGPF